MAIFNSYVWHNQRVTSGTESFLVGNDLSKWSNGEWDVKFIRVGLKIGRIAVGTTVETSFVLQDGAPQL